MILLIAIVLAIFLLPWPWSGLAVAGAAVWEAATAAFGYWYSHRESPTVGRETLVGRRAEVLTPLNPVGQVRLGGEIWEARCREGARTGDAVRIRAVEGLTLLVEREPASTGFS